MGDLRSYAFRPGLVGWLVKARLLGWIIVPRWVDVGAALSATSTKTDDYGLGSIPTYRDPASGRGLRLLSTSPAQSHPVHPAHSVPQAPMGPDPRGLTAT
jgi:hypothetical protein